MSDLKIFGVLAVGIFVSLLLMGYAVAQMVVLFGGCA